MPRTILRTRPTYLKKFACETMSLHRFYNFPLSLSPSHREDAYVSPLVLVVRRPVRPVGVLELDEVEKRVFVA